MWPRLLEQLLELLPHLTRLVPLADRYLTSRSAAERAHEEDLSTLHTGLRGLTRSHDRLTTELASQTPKLDHIAQQIELNRTELRSQATQLQTVTQQLKRLQLWAIGSAFLSALLLLAILVLLLFRKH